MSIKLVIKRKTKFIPICEPTDHWRTPDYIYKKICTIWAFNSSMFDPCPNNPIEDGLKIPWKKYNFINPPYSRGLQILWIQKGIKEAKQNKICIFLLPSDTSTKLWHEYIMLAHEICFVYRRIRFVGALGAPKFGSVIVVFKGKRHSNLKPEFSTINFEKNKIKNKPSKIKWIKDTDGIKI